MATLESRQIRTRSESLVCLWLEDTSALRSRIFCAFLSLVLFCSLGCFLFFFLMNEWERTFSFFQKRHKRQFFSFVFTSHSTLILPRERDTTCNVIQQKEIHNTYNIHYTREQQQHYTKNLKNITKKKGRRTDRESFDNTPPRRLRRTFLYIRRRFRTPSRFDTVRCGL